MKQFQVVHPHEALEHPLTMEADVAEVSWHGHLRFYRLISDSGDDVQVSRRGRFVFHRVKYLVAEFAPRSWASWWEKDCRVLPEKPEQAERPKPYGGTLTPVERPNGWMK